MLYDIEDIKREVRVCLDQNMNSEALAELEGDENTLALEEIIESKIADAAYLVLMSAQPDKLGDVAKPLDETATIAAKPPYKGVLPLPADFARLVRFKLSGWRYAVFEAFSATSPLYGEASSEFGVFGTKDRPAVFLAPSVDGAVLEFFCAASAGDKLDGCLYAARPNVVVTEEGSSSEENNGNNDGNDDDNDGNEGNYYYGAIGSLDDDGNDQNNDGNDGGGIVLVEYISLSQVTLNLSPGDIVQLKAEVFPEDATNKKIRWHSTNTYVAIVDQEGNVEAQETGGNCKIIAYSTDSNKPVFDKCDVFVTKWE